MPYISGRYAPLRGNNCPWFYGDLCQAMSLAPDLHTEHLSMFTGLLELFLYACADRHQSRWKNAVLF